MKNYRKIPIPDHFDRARCLRLYGMRLFSLFWRFDRCVLNGQNLTRAEPGQPAVHFNAEICVIFLQGNIFVHSVFLSNSSNCCDCEQLLFTALRYEWLWLITTLLPRDRNAEDWKVIYNKVRSSGSRIGGELWHNSTILTFFHIHLHKCKRQSCKDSCS